MSRGAERNRRVVVPLQHAAADDSTTISGLTPPTLFRSRPALAEVSDRTDDGPAEPTGGVVGAVEAEDEALEILTLARRTADGYLAAAKRQAKQTCDEARQAAGEIRRDADAYAERVRAEADQLLADAATAADETAQRAQQRYEDAVGNLSIKREGLQKQIEALTALDADYRYRIASFVQSQIRSLWTGRHYDLEDSGDVHEAGGPI